MDRPRYASDAIETSPAGLHVGRYGDLLLRSAYQPIFRIDRGTPVLAAWEGLIRPSRDGVPVAPELLFAHVDDGDHLFVECLCRALHLRNYRLARPHGRHLFINVNPAKYESVEVIEREFAFMFSVLEKYGLSPDRLVCELVEEEAIGTETLARLCQTFRERGARIALDDFGSGSSGMERYRALQPEVVKVDGALFRDFSRSASGRRMLAAVARTFIDNGTAILVEGVEEPCHLQLAIGMGATYAQGYGLAAPHLLPHRFATLPARMEPPAADAAAG